MGVADIKNFLVIDERVACAGQPTELQLAEVAAAGYTAVINLGLLDPRYCLSDEAAVCAALSLRYRHIPVAFEAPVVADFEAFLRAMEELSQERVFVHCAANYRGSSFLALYGELRLGWSRQRAEEVARSQWQPNPVWLGFLATCRGRWLDSVPPGAVPPGAVPPGAVPPGAVPPGAVPPGAVAPGAVPPGAVPPGAARLRASNSG